MIFVRISLAVAVALTFGSGYADSRPSDSAYATDVETQVVEAAAVVPITPLSGVDRYGTAVAVAKAAYPSTSEAVVLATGRDWPDAVGGSPLAGIHDGPILLVKQDSIPDIVLTQIDRLDPDNVFVLGGTSAVSAKCLSDLAGIGIDPDTVRRIAGDNRYQTAALVASTTIDANTEWGGHAYVATGRSYADALSVGALAAATGDPVYLTEYGRWDSTIASITAAGATDVTILGGVRAVSAEFQIDLETALGGAAHVSRLEGVDRYQTATRIAERAVATAGFSYAEPGLVTGQGWADAAAAGPMLGLRRSPLLLVGTRTMTDRTAGWLYARRAQVAAYFEFGGFAALAATVREEAQHALMAPPFSETNAMAHVTYLAGLGPRGAGTTAERLGFDYIAARLADYGYSVTVQTVYLPGGGTSRNVIAEHTGSEPGVVVLGGHVDSKPPSPGGNDNASGVGVMLELARVLAQAPTAPTVRFVGFGAEEISGPTADDHHFGSRQYVERLSTAERAAIQGAISIDMVGYGSVFNVRSLRIGPQTVVASLQSRGTFVGQPLIFLLDPSGTGWSDHEAFEFADIPAAWLEWRVDPVYHTVYDTAAHVQPSRVRACGRLLRGWLLSMSPAGLDALR